MNTRKVLDVLTCERGLCDGQLQNGARCVVGALLFAVGYTPEELRGLNPGLEELHSDQPGRERAARSALWREYRISRREVARLIELNDHDCADEWDDEFVAWGEGGLGEVSMSEGERLNAVIFGIQHWRDYQKAYTR